MKKDGRLASARRAKMPGVRSSPAGRSGRGFRRFTHQGANRIAAFFNKPLEACRPRFRQRYFKLLPRAETYVPAVGVLFKSDHGPFYAAFELNPSHTLTGILRESEDYAAI
jgi:hypothetical protein